MKRHLLFLALMGVAPLSQAASDEAINTAWVVTASALVFFMQAGFALLESGMSRAKNAVNVMMKNFMDGAVGSLVFWLVGFGLMFGSNLTGWIGQSHFAPDSGAPWDFTFLLFQMMFAATAATIASGAMAERTRYGAYLAGAVIICGVIYPVFGSWAWGGAYGGGRAGWPNWASSTLPARRWCTASVPGVHWPEFWCWDRVWVASPPMAARV